MRYETIRFCWLERLVKNIVLSCTCKFVVSRGMFHLNPDKGNDQLMERTNYKHMQIVPAYARPLT